MNPFNKRLAPPRVLGLPVLAALSGLGTLIGLLSAVVLPDPLGTLAFLAGLAALPPGMWAASVGDDIVFYRVYWARYRDTKVASQEALWV